MVIFHDVSEGPQLYKQDFPELTEGGGERGGGGIALDWSLLVDHEYGIWNSITKACKEEEEKEEGEDEHLIEVY